ncbi:DUF2264 domain-containing protein [Mangrovibacterium marinum]|uniref:DUF2264 domain-containing protein n=1 Tax=Mangrovibacterium marinum TaxID=1639118 RepID=A0A2T5BXN4_9BACT|nr:DUF2264 domain-containing protein [Mangrovibacterium marinum]PTN05912.1 hypothetical protein C8N47_1259 [Mangrovibacterium marinum]
MRNSVLYLFVLLALFLTTSCEEKQESDRAYWIETMTRIVDPVLNNLAENTLKKNMPFESLSDDTLRQQVSYLEAVGRSLCGIAPWLELGADSTTEGKLRSKYIRLVTKGISNAVNPEAPDYLVFDDRHSQVLVDAAFLAQALLRAPTQIWGKLDATTQQRLISELEKTRSISPKESNWLLFASMIEAAMLEFTGDCDSTRLYYGINRFCHEWYKGDGWYGDGARFHFDYYNSLVIHPMLTDVFAVLEKHKMAGAEHLKSEQERFSRFAVQQERLISPEGTYPVVGRSIVYRFGVFHGLAQASLMEILPLELPYGQVRSALTAVMRRQFNAGNNFDENGWLKVGFTGSQINMSEPYINTGSLYLCTAVMLPLGLPESHPFWSEPDQEWTNLKAWNGIDVGRDKAYRK